MASACVAIEYPQSSLLQSNASTITASPSDLSLAPAELPLVGPDPQNRPDVLALASGSTSDLQNFETQQRPEILQAMVGQEVTVPLPKIADGNIEPAQPVPASNRERDCLMRAMYFESNRSSPDGLLSVGTVVMNRLENGAWGNSICGVVGAKRQFAPGVLSRKMQGDLKDLLALADQIISGKRQPKLAGNVMFFHVAGMKFPYKNMRYVHVAGGNTFYYKAQRKRRA